jgi:WD40 repeat protein
VSECASRNPYVGPYALRYGENIYGRDREARQLLELLIAERIVLLYSPSGAGKTSLIQAALIPMLKKEEFRVLPVVRVNGAEGGDPCNRYVMSALLSLEQEIPLQQTVSPKELASMQFADYLTRRESASATGDRTFLIFDQFEEILTIDPLNRDAKINFFNQVGDALRDLKRWALFAMREDHVAALDPYLRPIPTRLKATFRLDLLTAGSARLAVQGPAKECGVMFTEEATTKLVDDLRQVAVQGPTGETVRQLGPYVEPVQLQVVCHRLWAKLEANVQAITEEHLAGMGDVDSALADYYADKVAQIALKSGVKERVLREWFDRRLITESGLRSQVMVGSENTKELNAEAITSLVDVHLIRGEERRGVMWLELAHDRLVNPIRTDNAAWSARNLSVLQHQAAVWQSRGRSDSLCLRAGALTEALAWSAIHAAEMTQTEKEFLEVCKRNHDARQGKRMRWAVAALAVVIAVITALGVIAYKQSKIATAQSIAARAYQLRDERLDTALLLATEAQRLRNLPDTFGTLLTAAYYNPRLLTYLLGNSPVNAVAFSHDETRVATGDFGGFVVLWDTKKHCVIEKFSKSGKLSCLANDAVRAIAFSADGRYMAVSSKAVWLRDLKKGENKCLISEVETNSTVFSLVFSSDSTLLASGDGNGKIVISNVVVGSAVPPVTLKTTLGAVRGLSFDNDTKILAAGCTDDKSGGHILIWTKNKQSDTWLPDARETAAASSNVRCLMVSPDGKYLAAGLSSGAVDLYDLSLSDPTVYGPSLPLNVAASGQHDGLVNSLAFDANSKQLITAGNDGTLRLWKVPKMNQVGPPFTGHVGRVFSVAFSGDNRTVASGGEDRCAILWDTSVRAEPVRKEQTGQGKFSIAFSPDGIYEADGYENGSVYLGRRGVTSPRKVVPESQGTTAVPIIAFSGDGMRMVTTTADGKLLVRDTSDNAGSDPDRSVEIDAVANNERKKIMAVAFNKDGSLVAAALSKKEGVKPQVLIWKVATQERLMDSPLECEEGAEINTIQFSPDSSRLATGGDEQFVSIWSLAGGSRQTPVVCREEHTGSIRDLAFSPVGDIFATASGDRTLILWNALTGAQIAPPLVGHQAPVVTATFSPDGKWLASGSDDHSVILWNVDTHQRVAQLTGHTDTVRALAFSRKVDRLYSGSFPKNAEGDGGLMEWKLDPKKLREICRERSNRNLFKTEWNAYIRSNHYHKTWVGLPTPGEE